MNASSVRADAFRVTQMDQSLSDRRLVLYGWVARLRPFSTTELGVAEICSKQSPMAAPDPADRLAQEIA